MPLPDDLDAVTARWGPWTAHNVELAPGVLTRPEVGYEPSSRLVQILQLTTDVVGSADLRGVRVADLGCLEGGFAIELALHGAETLGIEGREANIARARFAAESLGLEQCSFVQDDVRNFSAERYGRFDVILCLGLLYHLDIDSVRALLEAMRACCRRAVILDTHVTVTAGRELRSGGRTYLGQLRREHATGDSAETIRARQWASLDNLQSFWPTRASLFEALAEAGFSSVLECHLPQSGAVVDRVQLVAFAGEHIDVRTVPQALPPPGRYHAPSRPQYELTVTEALSVLTSKLRRRAASLRDSARSSRRR